MRTVRTSEGPYCIFFSSVYALLPLQRSDALNEELGS